jgi:hypothetical protein
MKTLGTFLCTVWVVWASSIPATHVQGEYVEARTADVWTGPCFANAEVGLVGNLAVMAWRVEKGAFQGVSLDGLSVVGVVEASHTLGDAFKPAYPVKSVILVDERATDEQRVALRKMAQFLTGDLLTDVVKTVAVPISIAVDGSIHDTKVTLKAGNLAEIVTRALEERDAICHSNEEVWYEPLAKLDHVMAAFTVASGYSGDGLRTTWSSPNKRSAFVGTFDYRD